MDEDHKSEDQLDVGPNGDIPLDVPEPLSGGQGKPATEKQLEEVEKENERLRALYNPLGKS